MKNQGQKKEQFSSIRRNTEFYKIVLDRVHTEESCEIQLSMHFVQQTTMRIRKTKLETGDRVHISKWGLPFRKI